MKEWFAAFPSFVWDESLVASQESEITPTPLPQLFRCSRLVQGEITGD